MKRILLFVVLFTFMLGTSCFAEVSKEKAEQFIGSCAGETMWFDKRQCLWVALKYIQKSERMIPINMNTSNKFKDKSTMYRNLSKSFQNIEKATIGIIDFDNHVVLINKEDGTVVTAKFASNDDLIEMFTIGIVLIDNPFDHGESEQDIDDIKNGKMHIGFTAEQAELCWGRPDKKNKTTTSYGTRQQWVYEWDKNTYLYIENDKVTAWQN